LYTTLKSTQFRDPRLNREIDQIYATINAIGKWTAKADYNLLDYAYSPGRPTGQTLRGGIGASENLTLESTSHGTKGHVLINPGGGNVGIGDSTPDRLVVARLDQNGATILSVRNKIALGNSLARALIMVESIDSSGFFGAFPSDYTLSAWRDRCVLGASSDATGVTISGAAAGHDIKFLVGVATECARFDTSGNLLLGLTSGLARLDVLGSTSPTVRMRRSTSLTNANVFVATLGHVTDQNMLDNFGASFSFQIRDSAGVDNDIASFGAQRAGADNSGSLVFKTYNAGVSTTKLTISPKGNAGFNTDVFDASAEKALALANGTAPAAHTDNQIYIYSADSSDATATLALYLEQAVEVIGTFAASHKIKIIINGAAYWIQLDAV